MSYPDHVPLTAGKSRLCCDEPLCLYTSCCNSNVSPSSKLAVVLKTAISASSAPICSLNVGP